LKDGEITRAATWAQEIAKQYEENKND